MTFVESQNLTIFLQCLRINITIGSRVKTVIEINHANLISIKPGQIRE